MHRIALTLGAIAAASALAYSHVPSSAESSSTGRTELRTTPISEYSDAAKTAASVHNTPAFVMAFVTSKGVEEFVSFGVSNRRTKEPVSERSQFQIASLSKIQTGIVIRNLEIDGILDPERRVLEYLPDSIDERIARNLGEATLGQLISHRSGLPRDTSVIERNGNDPLLEPLTDPLLFEDLAVAEMVGKPGEVYEYSNLGYALLGYIAERTSGESFEILHQRFVVQPHGLHRTMLELDQLGEKNLATPYRKEDGEVETSYWITGRLVAASGVFSTPEDLATLLVAQLSAYRSGEDPGLDLTATGMPVSETRLYGYGLNRQDVSLEGVDTKVYYHSGDMDGYAGFYIFNPDTDRGAVMLSTRGGEGADKLRALAVDYVLGRAPRGM